ncbi:DUF504 domain-containing protein [Methanoculleus horonobensis]|uniref:DUF504 domain-containing protein n=1 Tax=Methanoculleus horonobensis TaxID=528314 RepID=UPI001F1FDBAA|nr:DUF504 domain-containing protein [Methanoculleus horonobensis]
MNVADLSRRGFAGRTGAAPGGRRHLYATPERRSRGMRTSHRLLLRFYHDPGYDFSRIEVEYADRGAPGDRSTVRGDRVVALDAQYLEVDAGTHVACIPYHRVRRILYDGDVIWARKA